MTSTLPPIIQAFSGGLGAVVANVGSYPLDVVATRLQTSGKGSVSSKKSKNGYPAIQVIRDIIQEDGWRGLFAGIESDSAATLVSNFFYYYAYSYLRAALLHQKQKRAMGRALSPGERTFPTIKTDKPSGASEMLSVVEELGAGFIAGVGSRLISTPLSVVTVRLQLAKQEDDLSDSEDHQTEKIHHKHQTRSGVMDVMKHIYSKEGLAGFWKGFQSTVLLCTNPAITLFLFQAFRRVFLRGKDRDQPIALQGFIGAAVSNSIAVSLLYPLILVKTRLQSPSAKSKNRTVAGVINQVVKRKGIPGLYQGLEAQLLKGFFNQGLSMMMKQRVELMIIALYHMSRQSRAVS